MIQLTQAISFIKRADLFNANNVLFGSHPRSKRKEASSGTYVQSFINIGGCDSTHTLTAIISNSDSSLKTMS